MGTAHMTIKGMGNFTGEQTLSFQIVGAEYSLKTGLEDSHVIGSGIPLEFSFTRADDDALTFDRFVGAQVDGKELAEGQYTTRRGSLVVSLAASYLDGLPEGKHTLTVTFDDGSATADFTVTKAADSGSGEKKADSGDNAADGGVASGNAAVGVTQGSSKQAAAVTGTVTQKNGSALARTGDVTDRAALAALLCTLAGLIFLCRSRYSVVGAYVLETCRARCMRERLAKPTAGCVRAGDVTSGCACAGRTPLWVLSRSPFSDGLEG